MSAAIWSIAYRVDPGDRAAYLAWFHGIHIPEKLARPGYAWAAHYEATGKDGRYLALFGTEDARTFLAPTPGQLKARQDALTREMVSLRKEARAMVLAEVIRSGFASREAPASVRLAVMDSLDPLAEDERAAGIASRLASTPAAGAAAWASLLVPVLGQGRHIVLDTYPADATPSAEPAAGEAAVFAGRRIA